MQDIFPLMIKLLPMETFLLLLWIVISEQVLQVQLGFTINGVIIMDLNPQEIKVNIFL